MRKQTTSRTTMVEERANKVTHLRLSFLFILLCHEALHTVLFNLITLFQCMLMWTCNPITLTVPAIAVDTLDCVVALTCAAGMVAGDPVGRSQHAKWLLLDSHWYWLARGEETAGITISIRSLCIIRNKVGSKHRAGKVLGDLDLHIT